MMTGVRPSHFWRAAPLGVRAGHPTFITQGARGCTQMYINYPYQMYQCHEDEDNSHMQFRKLLS